MNLLAGQEQSHRWREWPLDMGQGEEEGGINWESSPDIYIYTIMCKLASVKQLYSAGNSAQYSVVT